MDVPSGIDADTGEAAGVAIEADRVVTFHDAKPGLAELDAEVAVADIGIPEAAERFVGPGDLLALERDPESHKGDHGRVFVIGGGPYTGAPAAPARTSPVPPTVIPAFPVRFTRVSAPSEITS